MLELVNTLSLCAEDIGIGFVVEILGLSIFWPPTNSHLINFPRNSGSIFGVEDFREDNIV